MYVYPWWLQHKDVCLIHSDSSSWKYYSQKLCRVHFFKTMTENMIIVAQCHGLIYKLCKKHIEKQRNLGEGEWYILFYFHHSEETLIANT